MPPDEDDPSARYERRMREISWKPPRDWDDRQEEGLERMRRGRWQEAVSCLKKAIELNPHDTVTWREGYAAEKALDQCRRKLIGLLMVLFEGVTARNVRDAALAGEAARRLRESGGSSLTAEAAFDLAAWASSLTDQEFEEEVRPALSAPASSLPAVSLRRYPEGRSGQLRRGGEAVAQVHEAKREAALDV